MTQRAELAISHTINVAIKNPLLHFNGSRRGRPFNLEFALKDS